MNKLNLTLVNSGNKMDENLRKRINILTYSMCEIDRIIGSGGNGRPCGGYTVNNVIQCIRKIDPISVDEWGAEKHPDMDWIKEKIRRNAPNALRKVFERTFRTNDWSIKARNLLIDEICFAPSPATLDAGITYMIKKEDWEGTTKLEEEIKMAYAGEPYRKKIFQALDDAIRIVKYRIEKNNEEKKLETTCS